MSESQRRIEKRSVPMAYVDGRQIRVTSRIDCPYCGTALGSHWRFGSTNDYVCSECGCKWRIQIRAAFEYEMNLLFEPGDHEDSSEQERVPPEDDETTEKVEVGLLSRGDDFIYKGSLYKVDDKIFSLETYVVALRVPGGDSVSLGYHTEVAALT